MAFELTGQVEKHLKEDHIAWLTTVTPSGRPAPRPVWFLWDGTQIITYSQPDVAKLRHLAANGQVTVHFNCTPGGGDVVVISGSAELPAGAPLPSGVPAMTDKYHAAIEQMGHTQEWYDAYSVAIHVTPDRVWTIPG
jgi:PPOX class probable F420-dependent enzyme